MVKKVNIDLNCDMGESYGRYVIGNDELLFPYISSCNIACGFHAGDPSTIERTIKNAILHNVRIGAHPSYPDLAGFGRRKMNIPHSELKSIIKYQIAIIKELASSHRGKMSYVKPHGALYNSITTNLEEAKVVIGAILEIDEKLSLMGLAQSPLESLASEMGINFISEAFADRRYNDSGYLVSRQEPDSIIINPEKAVEQIISIIKQKSLTTKGGQHLELHANSICIHGDNPGAIEILKAIHIAFELHGILLIK